MTIEITVPKLGWSMDEGTFVEWLKKNGDEVKAGDLLFALESDKAVQEIESLDNGILRIPENGPKKDEVVKVGQVLGYLTAPGEDFHGMSIAAIKPVVSVDESIAKVNAEPTPAVGHPSTGGDLENFTVANVGSVASAPAVSPRAARRAMAQGVDVRMVKGTGRNGRVTEKDVIAAGAAAVSPTGCRPADGPGRIISSPPTRRAIASRMMKSHSATAPVTLSVCVNASELVNFRNRLKAETKEKIPTYNDLFMKISALALQKHPGMNASWEGGGIILKEEVNIGMAVDTEDGLLVPVIRNVPALSLRELADQTRGLAERARQKKISADELKGGTFTLTNLGTTGVDVFTPIINYPECAVLGIGRITLQPAVSESGSIVSRYMVWLSLTFDHRIVDGAPAARFLDTIKKYVEIPDKELMP